MAKRILDNAYYEQLAGIPEDVDISRVDPETAYKARTRILPLLKARHLSPVIYAPQSVLELDTNATIMGTHRSMLDIPVAVEATEAVGLHGTRFIGKKALFDIPLLGDWLERNGGYAVDRKDPNLDGIRMLSLALLLEGQNLLNYGEGRRVDEDVRNIHEIKRSALLFAAMTGTPIIPFAVSGVSIEREQEKSGIFKRKKIIERDKCAPFAMQGDVVAIFGEPIWVGEGLELVTSPLATPTREHIRATKDGIIPALTAGMQEAMDLGYLLREHPAASPVLASSGVELVRVPNPMWIEPA